VPFFSFPFPTNNRKAEKNSSNGIWRAANPLRGIANPMAKRKGDLGCAASGDRAAKKAKRGQQQCAGNNPAQHALLTRYYFNIRTLREYVLGKLPSSSRIRRKKIESVGVNLSRSSEKAAPTEGELALGRYLDTTLVGCRDEPKSALGKTPDLRWEQWLGFSQKGDESYVTLSDGLTGSIYSQSEVGLQRMTAYPMRMTMGSNLF